MIDVGYERAFVCVLHSLMTAFTGSEALSLR